jgi:hypothetical protein
MFIRTRLSICLFTFPLLSLAGSAIAADCRAPQHNVTLATKLAALADLEYREFNGHRISDDGHLLKFGSAESETELLHDPVSGEASPTQSGRFAWRRVWEYWITLGRHVDGEPLHRKLVFVPGLLEDPGTGERTREIELATVFEGLAAEDDRVRSALREAAVRTALNDSAWSAAFISFLMDRAGLSAKQFRHTATHSDYIKAAFDASDSYAYRACDPAIVKPRIGDLLCYSRGNRPLKRFTDWTRAVQSPGFVSASHCEVVVDVDASARKIDTIGGNVLQSVARRRLRLNEAGLLSRNHSPESFPQADEKNCLTSKYCKRQNFNLQYWSVLLQLK